MSEAENILKRIVESGSIIKVDTAKAKHMKLVWVDRDRDTSVLCLDDQAEEPDDTAKVVNLYKWLTVNAPGYGNEPELLLTFDDAGRKVSIKDAKGKRY